jgi:hypothetical protein
MNSIPRAVNEIFNHKYGHITNSTVAGDLVESIEYDHINQYIWRIPLAVERWWYIAGATCQEKS